MINAQGRIRKAIGGCHRGKGLQAMGLAVSGRRALSTPSTRMRVCGQNGGFGLSQGSFKVFRIRIRVIDEDDYREDRAPVRLTRLTAGMVSLSIPCFGMSSQTLSLSKVFLYE